jgi:hypothetical protein
VEAGFTGGHLLHLAAAGCVLDAGILTRLDGMGRSPDALIVHPEQPRDSRQKHAVCLKRGDV